LDKNIRALEAGRRYVEENIPDRDELQLHAERRSGEFIVISGNQAVAIGSLAAGLHRYSGYPITPATDIMEFLAAELPKVGGSVVQAEDEMAALGMVLGSSFTGEKSMTATSGPGLSLMTEMLGLAAMAEIPSVVVDCQRAGPSTGMPTRHEQADLNLALHGGHGEIQRIVLAPVSTTDCFWQMINAFNLAEQFQLPVLVLSDTVLAVRTESIPRPDVGEIKIVNRLTFQGSAESRGIPAAEGHFLRYQYTDTGVAPMSIPGTEGGQYAATGLEHSEAGRPRYDAVTHMKMTEKRFKKMELAAESAPSPHVYGDANSDVGIITWGSTWGVVVEAIDRLAERGIRAHALAPRQLWPLPDSQLRPFMDGKRVLLVPEANYTGQLADLLASRYQRDFKRVNVYSGQPFHVSEIVAAIEGVHEYAR